MTYGLNYTRGRVQLSQSTHTWGDHNLWEYLDNYERRRQGNHEYLRTTARNPCKICGKYGWCLVHSEEDKHLCMHVASDIEVHKGMGGWIHVLGTDLLRLAERGNKWHDERMPLTLRASQQDMHNFYSDLLHNNPLTPADRDYLISCGLQDLSDYGTLKHNPQERYYCRKISDSYSTHPPDGIAGVYGSRDNKRRYINTWATGIMRAVRNHKQLIVGIEIRLDKQSLERSPKAKYQPFTSGGKHLGINADVMQYCVIPGWANEGDVWVVEGLKKAQILNEQFGVTVIAIRGVSAWSRVPDDLVGYFEGVNTVVVAYDMDYLTNTHVATQRQSLINALANKESFKVATAAWDATYKGIDDAILAGAQITTTMVHDTGKVYSLETAAQAIDKTMRDILDNHKRGIHVIQVTVGAGKTQGAIDIINEHLAKGTWFQTDTKKDARVLWLTDDNYDLLEEAWKKFIVKPAQIRGRSDDEESDFYCAEYPLQMAAGAAHHNIIKSVCSSCPLFKEDCSYINNTKRVLSKEKFVIGVKSSFFNESQRLDEFDIIIIDESLSNKVYDTKLITRDDLSEHIEAINSFKRQCGSTLTDYAKENLDYLEMYLEVLQANIDESMLNENYVSIDVPTDLPYAAYEVDKGYQDRFGKWKFPKKFVNDLTASKVFVFNGHVYVNVPQTNMITQLQDKVVINLDATPSKIKLKAFGESKLHYYEYRVKEYVNVYQVCGMRGTKKQLLDPFHSKRFLQAIEFIANKYKGSYTTVLSIKPFIGILQQYAKQVGLQIDMGWYGNHTRGFNKFEETDNLILAGNFCRNLTFMQMQQETLAHMNIEVELEDIIEEDTLSEMIQAAGRGRAARRKDNPLNLFVLTSRELPKYYKVVKISSLESLMGISELDQQAGNKRKRDEAEEKVFAYLRRMIVDGIMVCSVPQSVVTDETGVSREVVRRVMAVVYKEQLQKISQRKGSDVAQLINQLSESLAAPTKDQSELLQLKLTSVNTSILNTYSLDELKGVIFGSAPLRSFLQDHPPVGVNYKKWNEFVYAMCLNKKYDSVVALAEQAQLSRQIATKYLGLCAEHVMVWKKNIKGVEFVHRNPRDWKPFENEWILREFGAKASMLFSASTPSGSTYPEDIVEAIGLPPEKVESDLFDISIYLNHSTPLKDRTKYYKIAQDYYDKWLAYSKRRLWSND